MKIDDLFKKGHRISKNSSNATYFSFLGDKQFIMKVIKEKETLLVELKNYKEFKSKGFKVPHMYKIFPSKGIIVYERVQGFCGYKLDTRKILSIIEELVKIQKWKIKKDIPKTLLFIKKIEENKYIYEGADGRTIFTIRKIIQQIKKVALVGVFKDAKPNNWIIDTEENIYLLDFEYVKESFFMSDFAQFLVNLPYSNVLFYQKYLDIFMQKMQISMPFDIAKNILFLLMCNACGQGILHNKNLSNRDIEKKKKKIKYLLNHIV